MFTCVDWNMVGAIGTCVGAVVTFLVLLYAVGQDWLTAPKLRLSVDPVNDVNFQGPTNYLPESMWARFRVTNVPASFWRRQGAKNCRAYVIGVYKHLGPNKFQETDYHDVRQLVWTHSPQDEYTKGRDLLPGVVQRVDLATCRLDGDPNIPTAKLFFQVLPPLGDLVFERGTYLVRVQVSAEGVMPQEMNILVNFPGHWKSLKIEKYTAYAQFLPSSSAGTPP